MFKFNGHLTISSRFCDTNIIVLGTSLFYFNTVHRLQSTNTKSLAKEFSKILIFEYFGYLTIGFDVFFDADSESPRMT